MQPHASNVFATRLRAARTAKGLSQEKLGILAGIDESSASARMNQYERGKHVPDFLMVFKIAQALELPPAYFYTEDDLLAEIIQRYHLLTDTQKHKALELLKQL